jgi:probable F420-dependent oxidoreductase
VRLGTSVLVLPYHNPVRLAKAAATLDVLCGGRLVMGVGVGLIEKEMQAMGTPFAERGAYTDEAIAVMRALWAAEEPRFAGKYYRFEGMKFSPRPLQTPSIPLVIGGVSRAAIRRAARLGDGWQPLGLSPEALGQGIAALRDEARACGRDAAKIPVSIAMTLAAARAGRHALGTAPSEIVTNARAYADVGVDTLIISAGTSDPARRGPPSRWSPARCSRRSGPSRRTRAAKRPPARRRSSDTLPDPIAAEAWPDRAPCGRGAAPGRERARPCATSGRARA